MLSYIPPFDKFLYILYQLLSMYSLKILSLQLQIYVLRWAFVLE